MPRLRGDGIQERGRVSEVPVASLALVAGANGRQVEPAGSDRLVPWRVRRPARRRHHRWPGPAVSLPREAPLRLAALGPWFLGGGQGGSGAGPLGQSVEWVGLRPADGRYVAGGEQVDARQAVGSQEVLPEGGARSGSGAGEGPGKALAIPFASPPAAQRSRRSRQGHLRQAHMPRRSSAVRLNGRRGVLTQHPRFPLPTRAPRCRLARRR
jgi:hypothetical protein